MRKAERRVANHLGSTMNPSFTKTATFLASDSNGHGNSGLDSGWMESRDWRLWWRSILASHRRRAVAMIFKSVLEATAK